MTEKMSQKSLWVPYRPAPLIFACLERSTVSPRFRQRQASEEEGRRRGRREGEEAEEKEEGEEEEGKSYPGLVISLASYRAMRSRYRGTIVTVNVPLVQHHLLQLRASCCGCSAAGAYCSTVSYRKLALAAKQRWALWR